MDSFSFLPFDFRYFLAIKNKKSQRKIFFSVLNAKNSKSISNKKIYPQQNIVIAIKNSHSS
jgi:hypothetical protein